MEWPTGTLRFQTESEKQFTRKPRRNQPFAQDTETGFVGTSSFCVLLVCCLVVVRVLAAARSFLPLPGLVTLVGFLGRVPGAP